MTERFQALLLEHDGARPEAVIRELTTSDLPPGEVLVEVRYSALNYKDGMILKGLGNLVQAYPHVPGIDLAGTVLESVDPRYRPGDRVLLTGFRVGEIHWGGYAQRARVQADWLVPQPAAYTARQAMAAGTAGFTAMLAIQALEEHGLEPAAGEVLVTGASGGVGSLTVLLLASLGHNVTAVTGHPENTSYLQTLGATSVLPRQALGSAPAKPLLGERWAGCVDTVGGDMLAHVLAGTAYGRSVAACGLAGGSELQTTVFPFLLRGVNLLGVDSVMYPQERRCNVWQRLATLLPGAQLDAITSEVGLEALAESAERILNGDLRGRTVVRLFSGDTP